MDKPQQKFSIFVIISFYIVLIAILGALGAQFAPRQRMEPRVGYMIGSAIGAVLSWVLWNRFGSKMVQQ